MVSVPVKARRHEATASTGSSRRVTTRHGISALQLQVERVIARLGGLMELEFSLPLSAIDNVNLDRIDHNGAMLVTDYSGLNFTTNQFIKVLCKPAATRNTWSDVICMGDVKFSRPVTIVMVGVNQILGYTRRIAISQMVTLLYAIRSRTDSLIIVSGLYPRLADHQEMGRAITEFGHAIAAVVKVVGRKHANIRYVAVQQLFLDQAGSCISKYYITGDVRLNADGRVRLMAHWLLKAGLVT